MPADEVESIIESKPLAQQLAASEDVKPLNDNGGDRKTEEGRSVLSANAEQRGTGTPYLVRRLKRDAPEVAEAWAGARPATRPASAPWMETPPTGP